MSNIPTMVYCWGSGAGGALGAQGGRGGDPVRISLSPILSPASSSILPSPARLVAAGRGACAAVTECGSLFTWGGLLSDDGVPCLLGRPSPRGPPDRLVACRARSFGGGKRQRSVEGLTFGGGHAVAVTSGGDAYGWGDASGGRLGLGSRRRTLDAPRRVPSLSDGRSAPAVSVACGDRHTVVARGDGTVVAAGSNEAGQLGTGRRERGGRTCAAPTPVAFPGGSGTYVESVSCGPNHSAAVSRCRKIFTWGWGERGRLGHGDEEMRPSPARVEAISSEAFGVACGASHTLVLAEDGDVFGFGWNAYGQVGDRIELGESVLFPVKCLQGTAAINISGGFGHSAAVTVAGELFTWGFNEDGQLGHGHERNISVPSRVKFSEDAEHSRYVVSVACGHTYTLCITSDSTSTQIRERREHSEAKLTAERVLIRFARFVLFCGRLRRFRRNESSEKKESCQSELTPFTEEKNGEDSISVVSESEDLYDYEDNAKPALPCNPSLDRDSLVNDWMSQYYLEQEENKWMFVEDQRSRKASDFRKATEVARKSVEEEHRLQWEVGQMRAEDLVGKERIRHEKRHAMMQRKKLEQQKVADRNARANQRIQREVDRLSKARERKNKQHHKKALAHLPNLRQKPHAYIKKARPDSMMENRDQNTNVWAAKAKSDLYKKKNMKYLQNRQKRLTEKAQRAQSEEDRQRQTIEDARVRKEKEERLVVARRMQEESMIDRLLRERRAERQGELCRLKERLGLSERHGGNTNITRDSGSSSNFMSANQWGKKLKKHLNA